MKIKAIKFILKFLLKLKIEKNEKNIDKINIAGMLLKIFSLMILYTE
jgi:hypothetical protein